ncbi:unnamed protein product [Symbiodinium sp. CCMP2592]|nr:unnamed protein product [Symbiodinium sp. CCMP2592]
MASSGNRPGRPGGRREFRQLLSALREQHPDSDPEPEVQNVVRAREVLKEVRLQKLGSKKGVGIDEDGAWMRVSNLAVGSELQQRLLRGVHELQLARQKALTKFQELYRMLFKTRRPVASMVAESKSLEADRFELAAGLQQAACFLILFSAFLIGVMLIHIAAMVRVDGCPYVALLLQIRRKYDETPSKICVSFRKNDKTNEKEQNATAKVMQSRIEMSVLLKDTRTGKYCYMDWLLPTWLQALDRTTALNTKKVQDDLLSAIPGLRDSSKAFRLLVHQVCTDRYSANVAAENMMSAELPPHGATSHYFCDVHKVALIEGRCMRFVSGHVSALISAALALSESGCLRRLRKSLEAVLQQKLKVRAGVPPRDDYNGRYREAILDAFLPVPPRGSRNAKKLVQKKRCIFSYFLNDDLQDTDSVSFWTPHWSVSRATVLEAMTRHLIPVLLPHKPPMFFRSKWTGFEHSYEYFGLLALAHGLLRDIVAHFFTAEVPAAPSAAGTADAQAVADDPGDDEVGDGANAQAGDVKDDPQLQALTGDIDWKVLNIRMRERFRLWVESSPGAVLLLMALVLRPLLNLVHRLLTKSSKLWESEERAKQARGQPRTYAVLEAARGTDLRCYRTEAERVFNTEIIGIHRSDFLLKHQALAFRMLSSTTCGAEFYLGTSWRSFPVQIFQCLDGGKGLGAVKECLLCPLSRLLLEHFPAEDELSPSADFMHVVRALACKFSLDISDLESRHATTRRIHTIRSVQAKRSQLTMVSADWACRTNATNRSEVLMQETECQTKSKEKVDDKQGFHRANPWYAFVSDECEGKIASAGVNMKSLSQKFRSLDSETKDRYTERAAMSKLAAERNLKAPAERVRSTSSNALVAADAVEQDLQHSLDLVKQDISQQDSELKQHEESVRTALLAYKDESVVFDDIVSECVFLQEPSFPALVGLDGRTLHIRADDFGEVLLSRGERSQVRAALRTEWERLHNLYIHDEQAESFIVLRLTHTKISADDSAFGFLDRSWSEMALRALGSTAEADDETTMWLHVGHTNLSTWRMAFLELEPDQEPRTDGLQRLNVSRPYKAAESLIHFANGLNFNLSWTVTAFVMVSDDRWLTVPEMVPNWVLVRELESVPSFCVWQGWELEQEKIKAEALAKEQGRKRGGRATSEPQAKRARGLPVGASAASGAATLEGAVEAEAPVAEEAAEQPEGGLGGLFESREPDFLEESLQDPQVEEDARRAELERQEELLKDFIEGRASDCEDKPSESGSDEDDVLAQLEAFFEEGETTEAANAAHPRHEPGPGTEVASGPDAGIAEPASGSGNVETVARRRPQPTTVVVLPGLGEIRYNTEQRNFVAVCKKPEHASSEEAECKKTRTVNPTKRGFANPGQGRPLGLLVAWLRQASDCACSKDHKDGIVKVTKADRKAARQFFYENCAGARSIAEYERAKDDGESSEPEVIK